MAVGLAAELQESLGLQIELIQGSKGIFNVKCGNKIVFSKYTQDRFPRLGEISEILKAEPYNLTHD